MAKNPLLEAVKCVRYAPGLRNWLAVGQAALRGAELTTLSIRSGLTVVGVPGNKLVHQYKELYYRDVYGVRARPIPAGSVVVDIGANIGMFSMLVATTVPGARVFCFEPFPENFRVLTANLERNGLGNVKAVPSGVAATAGDRTLHVAGHHGAHSMFADAGTPVTIRCTTLADLFAAEKIERCGFLKLDCEGAEFEILLEAPRIVLERIDRVAMEYHDWVGERTHLDLERALEAAGMRVHSRHHASSRTGYLFGERPAL